MYRYRIIVDIVIIYFILLTVLQRSLTKIINWSYRDNIF